MKVTAAPVERRCHLHIPGCLMVALTFVHIALLFSSSLIGIAGKKKSQLLFTLSTFSPQIPLIFGKQQDVLTPWHCRACQRIMKKSYKERRWCSVMGRDSPWEISTFTYYFNNSAIRQWWCCLFRHRVNYKINILLWLHIASETAGSCSHWSNCSIVLSWCHIPPYFVGQSAKFELCF